MYFQAFTSLSTGLERIGKLCLMLDHYIQTRGRFPDFKYMKYEIGHKLGLLYQRSQEVIGRRSISLDSLQELSDPVHQAIVSVLHNYAEGDRYSNINLLVGSPQTNDPVAAWFNEVDLPLFAAKVSDRKKEIIKRNAAAIAAMMGSHSSILHISETGARSQTWRRRVIEQECTRQLLPTASSTFFT
ncbi:hypothetical protein CJO84_07885 [Ralstonia solanacearum]|nr:hypothetical protein CJO84_07885 [Ralstonia solanacearum]